MSMTMTDLDVLQRFQAIVGMGGMGKVKRQAAHHKQAWQWWSNGPNVLPIMEMFRPWLGQRRLATALSVLERREAARDALTFERACSRCGSHFRPRVSRSATKARYCTAKCLTDAKNQRRRERANSPARSSPHGNTCDAAGP